MVDFFGTPWREVTLKTVRDFLAAAGDEGIDWETKGTELPRAEQVRKAICGLANQKGGFFLIGARREQDGEWIADGVDFGVREPGTWMSDILRNGDQRLRPEPQFDVKAFDVDEEGSKLVVVMVEEIDQKPCMTGGRAALRLPGQTVWIEDPAHLRRLATEGQGVEDEAEAIALRAAEALGREEPPDEPYLRFVIAFAPTQKPEDLGARIFPQAFLDYLDEVAGELPRGPLFHEFRRDRFLDTRVADRTSVVAEDQDGRQRWKVRVAWDGSVALRLDAVADRESDARFLSEVFGPMLVERSVSAAEKLVARLGGAGRSHVVMMVGGEGFSVHVQGIPFTFFDVPSLDRAIAAPIQTRTNPDGELTDDEIARITREFLRECGAPVVEPEPAE